MALTTKREFPPAIYVLRKEDDTFAYYESEAAIAAPVGVFAEVATYTFTDLEEFQRKVVFEKRRPTPAPEEPPVVIP